MLFAGSGIAATTLAFTRNVTASYSNLKSRGQVDGLPEGFRYHDLRHYFASLLVALRRDVKTVQARLRHASAKTTLGTYGHLWPDCDEPTMGVIDAVIAERFAA